MKYSVNFSVEKRSKDALEGNVRMIIQWSDGGRLSMFVGHKVTVDKWSKDAQRCKNNTMHGKYTSTRINKDIQRYEDAANKVMQSYDNPPTSGEVKTALLSALGKEPKEKQKRDLIADIRQFIIEQAKLKSWGLGTSRPFRSLITMLKQYKREPQYSDISTRDAQDTFILYLQNLERKATTIREYINCINWFLRWAERKEYIAKAPNYRPSIKTAPKKVIYLTREELFSLYNAPLESKKNRRIRDFFCLSCFTGLRYSDVFALKKNDIKDGVISIISRKDTDNLNIELNKYSREILSRAELTADEIELGCAMPRITANHINTELRKICKECGINSPVTQVYYKGDERVTETREKWEVITTHVGRKTFICTALSQGISPAIIMKWTGHSDYKAMRPYIDIIDEAKKNAMRVFDDL